MAGLAAIGSFLAKGATLAKVATGLSLAGTAIGTVGAIQSGKQQQEQLEAEAKQAEALSQQEAIKRRREGALLESRQRALAAAQGGAADASVLQLLGETAAETERAAQTEIYRGRTAASGARYRGQVAAQQGRIGAFGSALGGTGQILGNAASAFDRFNGTARTSQNQTRKYRYG